MLGYDYVHPIKARQVVNIIDRTKTETDIAVVDVEQKFYEDDKYIYLFGNPKKQYVIVKYSDGSQETVDEALNNEHITIKDLDRYHIEYYKEDKEFNGIEILY